MGKLHRFFENNIPYFITTSTHQRRPIFSDMKHARMLLVSIEYFKTVFDFTIQGYCLMPDHLHMIMTSFGRFHISHIMKMIKGSFTRRANKLSDRQGSLWQPGFYDEAVRNEKQLLIQLEYMHANPVKANLVTEPDQYLLSSSGQYNGTVSPELSLLATEPISTTA